MLQSRSARIILFLIIPIIIAAFSFFYNFAGLLFSAGPVTLGHEKYFNSCFDCHAIFSDMSSACLDCHEELEKQVDNNFGFHGNMEEEALSNCMSCHTDHRGPKYFIITDTRSREQLTRLLTNMRGQKERKYKIPDTPLKAGYENLWNLPEPDNFDFKTYLEKLEKGFDHNLTGYPLLADHAKVKCGKCHKNIKHFEPSQKEGLIPHFELPDLNRKEFCFSCHENVDKSKKRKGHEGKYGKICEDCHIVGGGPEKGWKNLKPKIGEHHDKKNHKLEGKHKETQCRKCHEEIPFEKKKEEQTCYYCHEEDDKKIHEKSLGKECKDCHTPEKFTKSKFDHQKTDFPLEYSHKKAKCDGCHPKWEEKEGKPKIYDKITDQSCYSCHAKDDTHKGTFKLDCERCHRITDWTDVKRR